MTRLARFFIATRTDRRPPWIGMLGTVFAPLIQCRETHQILIGPLPKISPEFVGLLFFRLLWVEEMTEEMTRKCEGHRIFHGDAKFVEANLQPFLSTFSVSG